MSDVHNKVIMRRNGIITFKDSKRSFLNCDGTICVTWGNRKWYTFHADTGKLKKTTNVIKIKDQPKVRVYKITDKLDKLVSDISYDLQIGPNWKKPILSNCGNIILVHNYEDCKTDIWSKPQLAMYSIDGYLIRSGAFISDPDTEIISSFHDCGTYALLNSQSEDGTLMIWDYAINEIRDIAYFNSLGTVTPVGNDMYYIRDEDGLNLLTVNDFDNTEFIYNILNSREEHVNFWVQPDHTVFMIHDNDGCILDPIQNKIIKRFTMYKKSYGKDHDPGNNEDYYCNGEKLVYFGSPDKFNPNSDTYCICVFNSMNGIIKPLTHFVAKLQWPNNNIETIRNFKFIDDTKCVLSLVNKKDNRKRYKVIDVNLNPLQSKL
jgi:hypothetical protein